MTNINNVDQEEYERRKQAIFESMSKRGKQRILKMGYENWDPFLEPKDPRERLASGPTQEALELLKRFYETDDLGELARSHHRELFSIANGLIRGEAQSRVILAFCCWYIHNQGRRDDSRADPWAD